jgi:hypothetical protein
MGFFLIDLIVRMKGPLAMFVANSCKGVIVLADFVLLKYVCTLI